MNSSHQSDIAPDTSAYGPLLIIGGHEAKEGGCEILCQVVQHAGGGKIVVVTAASQEPDSEFDTYLKAFQRLGACDVRELRIELRAEALRPAACLEGAAAIFFSGGDQVRLSSVLGSTPVLESIQTLWANGCLIAGTSAGASIMSEIMIIGGESETSCRSETPLQMGAGFGFVGGVIIDQHFSQRGRFGRLLSAVAYNPACLGIGIDEDTAAFISNGTCLTVSGSGAVYILDGRSSTYSNVGSSAATSIVSISDVIVHSLCSGDTFDLRNSKRRL
ncbi:MAG: cyanophycinase [Verrucomicrobiaceae bacterium]|nr:cyanophycinase [Verrucomicrobiaceae bacterium]